MTEITGEGFEPARKLPDWVVPSIIGSALLMQNLSATVVANALPTMARELRVDAVSLNLTITAFMVSGAIFLPVSGWLADRFGARPIFAASIVVFLLGSAGCGFAHSLDQLILARIVQGAASAMLMPVGRLVLLRTVPKSELIGALAVLTMPAIAGPMIGPPIGGFIATFGDWRWIFFLNLPIGIVGLMLVWRFVPDVREEERLPLDWIGFALAGIACAGLVFGFESLGRPIAWWIVAAMLAVGAGAGALLFAHARRHAAPILDPSIFAYQTFTASLVGGGFLRLAVGAQPFLLALLLQFGLGMSAFQAGIATFFTSVGALAMKLVATPLIRRFGFRNILVWNGAITAATLAAYALFSPRMPLLLIFAILLFGGFFRSLQFTTLNSLGYAEIPIERMSRASTLSAMGQQLSLSMGVGVSAVLLNFFLQAQHKAAVDLATIEPVLVIMGLFSMLGAFWFVRLPRDAGSEMIGARGADAVE